MGPRRRNADEFFFGRNFNNRNGNNNDFVDPASFNGNENGFADPAGFNGNNDVETIVFPTENIVNTTTNRRTVRQVHPTHILNVNRNITRVENFFPVTESEKDINIVEEFNCGSDLRNPCCRPVNRPNRCCHRR